MKDMFYAFKSLVLLLRKYPIVLLIKVIEIAVNVIMTIIPIKIVEVIVQSFQDGIQDISIVLEDIALYLIAMLVAAIINHIMALWMNYVDRNFKVIIATSLFQKLDSIDYDFHENTKFLNNYTRALEHGPDYIYNCANQMLALIRIIFQSAGVFGIIFQIHPLSVVYAIGIGLIYIIIKHLIGKLNYRLRSEQQPLMRRRNYYNRVFFLKDSIADLKTTNIETLLLDEHEEIGNGIVKIYDRFAFRRTCLDFIGSVLIASIYPVVLGIVIYFTIDDIKIAMFSALTVAATTLSTLVSRFVNVISDIETQAIECSVTFRVLAMESKIEGIVHPPFSEDLFTLEIRNLFFGYTETDVLKDVSIKVSKGQKIAIIGANGAGKTTLVKLLLRLYDPKAGQVLLNGCDYRNIATKDIRRIIGAVFQNPEVYGVSVAENVLLRKANSEADEELVIESLKFSGLYEYVCGLEEGIHTLVTREFHNRGQVFSGGQIQKLAIARGYAQNYQLFILDEPSSALDPLAEASLYHNMLELGRDKTMIFISHRLSSTANADYIYLFADGKIAEEGVHEDLMALRGMYYEMFTSQSEKYLGGEDDE